MAVIICKSLDLSRFHWDKSDHSLVAESSDFGPLRDGFWWLQQIWDDSADLGIRIRSQVTGVEQVFYLDHDIYHGAGEDREFGGWCFKPVDEQCPVRLVVIHND